MVGSPMNAAPLDFRYGRKEIKDVFGETHKLQYLLNVPRSSRGFLLVLMPPLVIFQRRPQMRYPRKATVNMLQ